MYNVTVNRFFDAAHQLPDSESLVTKACSRLHGHTYHVVVNFENATNSRGGMVVDFKAIKDIIDELDHQFINDIFKKWYSQLDEVPETTAENIAKHIYGRIFMEFKDLEAIQVLVAEGYKGKESTSYVGYQG